MAAPSYPTPVLDPWIVSQLACPACLGGLSFAAGAGHGAARLICAACGRAYPIVDGIPVLIAERAEPGTSRA